MKRSFGRVAVLLLAVLAMASPVKGLVNDAPKRVLVLNSYHETYIWSDRVMDGVKSVFASEEDVELFITYMDTKHISSEEYFRQFHDLLALKFKLVPFDAIVSSDDNALNFLLQYRDELFPDVPVFFCGINDFDPKILEGRRLFTGVTEFYEVRGTLEMMLQLHPGTRQVVSVTDDTVSGQAFLNLIERAKPAFVGRLEFQNLHNLSPEELCGILEQLPSDALVLWAIYIRTPDGRALSSEASIHMMREATLQPIYCIWDVVGLGVVGGLITSPEYQGTAAASLALRYLRGEDVTDLPVQKSPLEYVFDYEALLEFGIPETRLPVGSMIRNRPYSLYQDHKMVIWSVLAVVILELTIIVSLIHYIMKRRQAEQVLATTREQLSQSRKMDAIGKLAGGVAHDFNNVLASIGGAAEVLEMTADEKDQKYVEMILSLTDRASQLTAKLLAFGRKGNMHLEPIDLHETIGNAVDILRVSLNKNIDIGVHADAKQSIVMGDESQLTNILLNLGINAEWAMPNGGHFSIKTSDVVLQKKLCSESGFKLKAGHYLCVEVGDSGCGIPEENLECIFEPFFTTREEGQGTGLGLASVYGSVAEHKGAIMVQSVVNQGTEFTILLPLTEERRYNESKAHPRIHGAGQTILVADDEHLVRNTTSKMLTDLNYHVLLATNGEDAVEVFKERAGEIDLVILDVVMPKLSGRKAYELIREMDDQIGFIFTSGFTGDAAISELFHDNKTMFLRKPYRTQDLHQMIVSILADQLASDEG
jgi:signal transduction histidine kinase/ActR/RegA family two-component response regulator